MNRIVTLLCFMVLGAFATTAVAMDLDDAADEGPTVDIVAGDEALDAAPLDATPDPVGAFVFEAREVAGSIGETLSPAAAGTRDRALLSSTEYTRTVESSDHDTRARSTIGDPTGPAA